MNWNERFRQVSKAQRPPATFGSFLGMSTEKTIADLRALIRAKDDEMAQMEAHVQSAKPTDADWMRDWNNLKARYKTARDAAQHALDTGTGGFLGQGIDRFFEGFTSAKQYIDAILKALMQSYPNLHVSKGDAADLFARMPFAMKPLPQPGTPPSSQLYQGLDTATKYMPDPVKATVAWLDPALVPQTADAPTYDRAKKKLEMSSFIFVGALIAGGVLIVSLRK